MDDFLEMVAALLAGLAVVLLIVGALAVGGAYALERPSCIARWTDSGIETRWSFFGGCQLRQANGDWITDTAYLALNKNVNIK